MNAPKEQISSSSLMFSAACYVQSSALLIGFISSEVKQDSWLVVILGFVFTMPILWLFTAISAKFPGKSLIEINDIVFGKVIGKFFSVLYIFFFFSLCTLNASMVSGFVVGSIMPETPKLVILVMFILVCCYAVRKGLETMTRYSALFVIIIILVLIINTVLLMTDMKFSNLQPSFTLPFIKYLQATQTTVFLPFAEIMVFFMMFPNLKNPANIKKPLLGGLIIGAITILGVSLRDSAVLGPLISYIANPAFEAVRIINFTDVSTRMEILYATILLMLHFYKISILLYATVKGLEQIFNLKSYKFLVPIVGVLIVYSALTVFSSSMEHSFWGAHVASSYSMFFELILPLITLITASIRGFHKKKEENSL